MTAAKSVLLLVLEICKGLQKLGMVDLGGIRLSNPKILYINN